MLSVVRFSFRQSSSVQSSSVQYNPNPNCPFSPQYCLCAALGHVCQGLQSQSHKFTKSPITNYKVIFCQSQVTSHKWHHSQAISHKTQSHQWLVAKTPVTIAKSPVAKSPVISRKVTSHQLQSHQWSIICLKVISQQSISQQSRVNDSSVTKSH